MQVYDRDDDSTDFIDALCMNLDDLIRGNEFTAPVEYRSWLKYFTASLSFKLVLKDYENGKPVCTDTLCSSSDLLCYVSLCIRMCNS